jgi:hypothetical protein
MYIEFQLDAKKTMSLLRSRLKQAGLCLTDVFAVPLNGQTTAIIVDHIAIPPTTRLERVTGVDTVVYGSHHVSGSRIQLVQPLKLYLAPIAKLEKAGPDPIAAYLHPDVELVLDLALVEAKDGLEMHADFADLRAVFGPALPDDLRQKIKEVLDGALQPTPLDLSPLADLTGSFNVAQAALNAGVDLSFLAIRIEPSSLALDGVNSWGEFYKGHIQQHLLIGWSSPVPVTLDANHKPVKDLPDEQPIQHSVGGDWSLFIAKELIAPIVRQRLTEGMEGNSQFQLDEGQGIDASWDCAGHLPRLIIKFSGDALDVGLVGQSVGVDITLTVLLGLAPGNTLTIGVSVAYDSNDWDVFAVELTSAIPVAFLGSVIGGAAGPIGALVGAIVGYVLGVIAGAVVATVYDPSLPGQPDCDKLSDTSYLCSQAIELPTNPIFGNLALGSVTGLCGGPLFLGTMPSVAELSDAKIQSVQVLPFSYGYDDACGSPTLKVAAQVSLYGKGSPPLHVCRWAIVDGSDPSGQFAGELAKAIKVTEYGSAGASSVIVEISLAATDLLPAYLAAPTALGLLLQTNGGSRQITLAAIPVLSAEDQQKLEFALVEAKIGCKTIAESFWGGKGGFNPRWHVDPGPEADVAAHWWQVAATGLAPGEAVELRSGDGKRLGLGVPDPRGTARVDTVLLPPEQSGVAISRVEAHGERASSSQSDRRVRIAQTVLHPMSTLRLAGRCVAAHIGLVAGTPMLFCITDSGRHSVYDLSDPRIPMLRRLVLAPGVSGVVRWKDGFLMWGDGGLRPVSGDLRCVPMSAAVRKALPAGIQAVATAGARLHVMDHGGEVHVFDSTDRKIGSGARLSPRPRLVSPAPWFERVSRVGRLLARVDDLGRVELWGIGQTARLG